MTLRQVSVPGKKVEIVKCIFFFLFETGSDMCRLFPSMAESKVFRCYGHMAVDVAVKTMYSDLQIIIVFSFKVVGLLIHFSKGFHNCHWTMFVGINKL